MSTKYFILIITVILVVIHLLAGSAPPARLAPVAPQARVGPVAPTSIAPTASVAPVAPVNIAPSAPTAPVTTAPIAPLAPVSPIPPQSANPYSPVNPYAYSYGSNNAYMTNGIPTAYLRNTNSVSWATNPPYGNPSAGYTNTATRIFLPNPISPTTNTPSPPIQPQ